MIWPPTSDVERFLAMLRFDSWGKLKEFQMDVGKYVKFEA
jgi:hypothetical protein